MPEEIIKKAQHHNKNKALLRLVGLTKQFNIKEKPIVDNINLTVGQGELFVLAGPSGCGKTTLLRMIAGFERPTAGKIFLDNLDITDLAPHERPINMMFQSYALFPHMNVFDNIAFGLRTEKNLSRKEIDSRVEYALDMVKMRPFAYRKPFQLSGGQKQRAALARSIIKCPQILLLDEPLGALDRKIRESTQLELIKIQNLLGITFIMVTHDQEEAMSMADRMSILDRGVVSQTGTPEEIYEMPNSKFVAEFVDSINLFKGIVVRPRNKKGLIGLRIDESDRIIMVQYKKDLKKDREVWVGLRPEELELGFKPVPKTKNQVIGKIIDFGFLGHKIVYYIEMKNKSPLQVTIPTSEKARNPNFAPAKTVFVSWCFSDGVVLLK
jgi:putrescine transport system ATP-binding protein